MKEFISDLGVIPSASGLMKIFCDNTGAIALAKEPIFHKRTKNIKGRFNSIWDQVQEGDIDICKIHTDLNVADINTHEISSYMIASRAYLQQSPTCTRVNQIDIECP